MIFFSILRGVCRPGGPRGGGGYYTIYCINFTIQNCKKKCLKWELTASEVKMG